MPIGEAQAYAGLNAAQLTNLAESAGAKQEDDVADRQLKQVFQKIAQKVENKKKAEGEAVKKATERGADSKVETLFRGLADGRSGAVGKDALATLQDAALSRLTNNQAKEAFGETTQRTPQVGFNAASSFQRTSGLPGADLALGQTPLASQALLVTTQAASQGEQQLRVVEQAIGEFVGAFGHGDASDTVKKKVFDNTARHPGSESHKAAMEWGRSRQLRLQTGPAQEQVANALVRFDPKDPAKLKSLFSGLEKFAENPKLLSPKLIGADMKANMSSLTKAVIGSDKLSVSFEAQEMMLSNSKFHQMRPDARAQVLLAVGRAPQNIDLVAKTFNETRTSRLPRLAQKLSLLGTSPEVLAQINTDLKKPEVAFPMIEWHDPDDPQPQKRTIAFKAKWNRVAQQLEKRHNALAKSVNKCTSLRALNELDVPRGFGPVIGEYSTPVALAQGSGCSLEEAQYIFDLSQRCEDHKASLSLAKHISTKRRFLRGRPEPRTHLKDKRISVAGLPPRTTITLGDAQQGETYVELRRLLGGATSQTTASLPAEVGANATAAPVSSPAEIAARNTQVLRPAGAQLSVGGARVNGWGNNTISIGMDAEVQRKKLAQLREQKSDALRADPTRLTRGPNIGRSSDFMPLAQIVANKVAWIQLSPAVKAGMRNLQITLQILESWYEGRNRIYSTLQALPWEQLAEIQQKSALLLGLQAENWNALATVLSANLRAPRELRGATARHNVNNVTMKGNL